jgi:hypothetical protein
LSRSAAATTQRAAELAHELGVVVSLDINYRSALWSAQDAGAALTDLVKLADIVFASDDEAELLGVRGQPIELAEQLAAMGSDAGGDQAWCPRERWRGRTASRTRRRPYRCRQSTPSAPATPSSRLPHRAHVRRPQCHSGWIPPSAAAHSPSR